MTSPESSSDSAPTVVDVEDADRFEARVGGELAALVAYRRVPGGRALTHTETEAGFAHRGIATQLVAQVLERMRAADEVLLPYCPFVLAYVEEHQEYVALVPEDQRGQFGLSS